MDRQSILCRDIKIITMATFIKAGFWEKLCKPCKGYKGWLNLDEFVQSLIPPAPEPTYRVYTALLTQNGVSNILAWDAGDGPLTIGRTYYIGQNDGGGDFTSVGAPNNNTGTYFCATGTTPNWGYNPGDVYLRYDEGAPVAIVLENTIGNIWFTYDSVGQYNANIDTIFPGNKTFSWIAFPGCNNTCGSAATNPQTIDSSQLYIETYNTSYQLSNNIIYVTPIEIRVYN